MAFPTLGLSRAIAAREAVDTIPSDGDVLGGLLREAEDEIDRLVEESLASAKLAIDDRGWIQIGGAGQDTEFTAQQHREISRICRAMLVTHPLIRRGVNLRCAYVWGQGVQITAGTAEAGGQDVNAVVQAFLDDPGNKASFTGGQAHEENERALAADGNFYLACFTDAAGFVRCRSLNPDQVVDVITNPEDRDDPWFYKRQYTVTTRGTDGAVSTTTKTVYHPDLRHRPASRQRTLWGDEVLWDAPVKHVTVNRLNGWKYGLGDVYAALSWARMYADFLTDWARLMKSLAKLAWHAQAKGGGRAGQVRDRITTPADDTAGGTLVTTDNVRFEAVSKSGATLDSESGRPLAAMVAAALDVPVTLLLADPGVTGARATAETLDPPTHLAMRMRRDLWTEVFIDVLNHVIDSAIRANRLRGVPRIDPFTKQTTVSLAGEQDRRLEVKWPPLDQVDPLKLVEAVVQADGTGKLPPLQVVKLLLHALGVENVDEVLEQITDDEGAWVDPEFEQALAAERRRDRGEPA